MRRTRFLLLSCAIVVAVASAHAAELTYQGVADSASGVPYLSSVAHLAFSPDGRNVYASRNDYYALIEVLARDPETGALSFVEVDNPILIGQYVRHALVSPDGRFVYGAASGGDAVLRFSRDAATGAIEYLDKTADGIGGVVNLGSPRRLAISADGAHLYVASVAPGGVSVFSRDAATGALSRIETELDNAGTRHFDDVQDLKLSPDGLFLYATSPEDAITLFARNPAGGSLTWLGDVGGAVLAPGSFEILPDGETLCLGQGWQSSLYTDPGRFSYFNRNLGTGALQNFGSLQNAPFFPVQVAAEPYGSHVFAGGSNQLVVFDFAAGNSQMEGTLEQGVAGVDGLSGIDGLAMAPDGRHLYALTGAESATSRIASFSTAVYDVLEVDTDGVGAPGLDGASSVTVSPDGENVYATGAAEDAIQVFSRNTMTGALGGSQAVRDGLGSITGLNGVRSVIVSPDGKNAYAAGSIADAVVSFTRNASGQLVYLDTIVNGEGGATQLNNPVALAITPDGKNVYVASSLNYSVSIFGRNTTTGTLSAGGHYVDGIGGVDGLFLAESIAVSPDNKNVYVGGKGDNEIAIFSRDPNIGSLTYMGVATGVTSVTGVAVSPDGKFVYAVAFGGDRLVRFARNAVTGALGSGVVRTHNAGVIDGLEGPRAVSISHDGSRLFVAGQFGNVLAIFRRDAVTGSVRLLQAEVDDVRTDDALGGIRAIAVSPDGRNVYAAAEDDDAVVSFVPEPDTSALALVALFSLAMLGSRSAGVR